MGYIIVIASYPNKHFNFIRLVLYGMTFIKRLLHRILLRNKKVFAYYSLSVGVQSEVAIYGDNDMEIFAGILL